MSSKEYPKMIYKLGGPLQYEGKNYSTLIVGCEDEFSKSLKDGWAHSPSECGKDKKKKKASSIVISDHKEEVKKVSKKKKDA